MSERNDVVVITGGAGALAAPYAGHMAKLGRPVALLDMNTDRAEALAAQISAQGGAAIALPCDVTDPASIEAAHAGVLSALGKCSVLVNCAGVNLPGSFTQNEHYQPGDEARLGDDDPVNFFNLGIGAFKKVMDINLFGAFLCSQVFARDMVGGGSIIHFSSMTATQPTTKNVAYSASKAAVSNLTQWMAVHLAPAGIRVNAVAPGFYITPVTKPQYLCADGSYSPRCRKVIDHTPMDRLGEAEDLVGTLVYLSLPEVSAFVTGTVIPVDGGFRAYSGI